MAKVLTMLSNDFQVENEDDWVRISHKEGVLLAEFKKPTLDASFSLQLRQHSLLFEHAKQHARLIVDLGRVSVANSSGLALLVALFQAMPAGSRLYLLRANAEISDLLRDTYLDQLFPTFDHINELPIDAIGSQG